MEPGWERDLSTGLRLRLREVYGTIHPQKAWVVQVPPGVTPEACALALAALQCVQHAECAALCLSGAEHTDETYARILVMGHPQYQLQPPGTPAHGEVDMYVTLELALECPPAQVEHQVSLAQRLALLEATRDTLTSTWEQRLIDGRLAALRADPASRPPVFDQHMPCKDCGTLTDVSAAGLCKHCTLERTYPQAVEERLRTQYTLHFPDLSTVERALQGAVVPLGEAVGLSSSESLRVWSALLVWELEALQQHAKVFGGTARVKEAFENLPGLNDLLGKLTKPQAVENLGKAGTILAPVLLAELRPVKDVASEIAKEMAREHQLPVEAVTRLMMMQLTLLLSLLGSVQGSTP